MTLTASPFTHTTLRALASELDRGLSAAADSTEDIDAMDSLTSAAMLLADVVGYIGEAEEAMREEQRAAEDPDSPTPLYVAKNGAALRVRS